MDEYESKTTRASRVSHHIVPCVTCTNSYVYFYPFVVQVYYYGACSIRMMRFLFYIKKKFTIYIYMCIILYKITIIELFIAYLYKNQIYIFIFLKIYILSYKF